MQASASSRTAYLDDWLFVAAPDEIDRVRTLVLSDCDSTDVAVNHDKSQLAGTRALEHLGFGVDLDADTFQVTPRRWDALQSDLQTALASASHPARFIARIVGQLISMRLAAGDLA